LSKNQYAYGTIETSFSNKKHEVGQSMDEIKQALAKAGFGGELEDSKEALELYSHDASMFEIKPKLIIAPKTGKDIEAAVKIVPRKPVLH
jgi:hypothetical protein